MGEAVFVSICIPAYKRASYLRRLLDSIQIQTYGHFEVVISDDSPDNEVSELVTTHALAPLIRYFKNEKPKGTPENWNESMRRAAGEWIKLMHDDDWFAESDALEIFVRSVKDNPGSTFFFSAYRNIFIDKNTSRGISLSPVRRILLEKNIKTLVSQNVIGPPSVVFHKKNPECQYDPHLKWLVDIDFYIRCLQDQKPFWIARDLIRVGISDEQVTQLCFRNPVVEIPENLYLLNKIGKESLKNIFVFDAFWRFIRNLDIVSVEQIRSTGYTGDVPAIIQSMIRFQSRWPKRLLKNGWISKGLMGIHYLFQYHTLARG